MSRYSDPDRGHRLDHDAFAFGYFRNAVYRHWDPYEDIPATLLDQDRDRLIAREQTEAEFDGLRRTLALFGAGEEAVTEDLAPLAIRLNEVEKEMFVIDPVAEACGFEVTAPTDERYFNADYTELFDRTETAMAKLLSDDSPEALVEAYCHYHLAVESVLAQTGYYGLQGSFSPSGPDLTVDGEPVHLEGLVEGISRVRSDEGRHVGFGMHEVQRLVAEGVDAALVDDTLSELLPLVAGTVSTPPDVEAGIDEAALVAYASEKLQRRIEIITDREATIPPVEELVNVAGREGAAD